MPEALEKWSVPLFENLLPRHMQLIYEMNVRFIKAIKEKFPGDDGRIRRMSLIEESEPKKIRMASLCVMGSFSVNGVSELHTELIKSGIFKDFYEFWPEKFNSKTNGITQRRWLYQSNTSLSKLITEAIGDGWITDAYELKKLSSLKKDASFQKKWQEAKQENKKYLTEYIRNTTGIKINEYSIFDVQIKRMHEYKRQLLFAFFMIAQYLQIKNNPKKTFCPRTFIVGGKSAPGYFMAKRIIKFINSIASVVNADKSIGDKLKIVFLENYRVSLAERIFPASELSEQISTAGCEASGTGNMKFMMNGALTIGTYDGANVEIAEAVGDDNIFIFGLRVADIEKLRSQGYNPQDYIGRSLVLSEIVKLIQNNFFSQDEQGIFEPVLKGLHKDDPYFVCADFDAYCLAQGEVVKAYADLPGWTEKSIINVAKSGKFSSDRTIKNYAQDIWGVPYLQPE